MFVKARKVGNSFALTIPASLVEAMNLSDGQEMLVDYNAYSRTLSYRLNKVSEIHWDEFVSQDTKDIRDGLSPEDYVRKLRDFDREEIIFLHIYFSFTRKYATGCLKHGKFERLNNFRHFLKALMFEVVPVNDVIALKAAEIRSQYQFFKPMDALQLATAFVSEADVFLQLLQYKDLAVELSI